MPLIGASALITVPAMLFMAEAAFSSSGVFLEFWLPLDYHISYLARSTFAAGATPPHFGAAVRTMMWSSSRFRLFTI